MSVTLSGNTKTFTIQLGVYNETSETFAATSELKDADYIQDCENQSIYLTWLNSLASWEFWNFTAEKDYGVDIQSSREVSRNTFESWDSNFANAETERFYHFVEAFETKVIRSQFLTEQQLNAIKNIRFAIQAQQIYVDDFNRKLTVLVDKESFSYRRDRQKLYDINFDIKETSNIPIQDQ